VAGSFVFSSRISEEDDQSYRQGETSIDMDSDDLSDFLSNRNQFQYNW